LNIAAKSTIVNTVLSPSSICMLPRFSRGEGSFSQDRYWLVVPEEDVMGLWLLSFTEREVAVILEAETLAHARLLAASNQVCRASLFDEGWAIKPSIRAQIPADFIGRALSQDETADLPSTLSIG
jgi:hypothetical protein